MTLLGRVSTRLGRIELHEGNGLFETHRMYTDTEQKLGVVKIRLSPERALEWYELCSRDGAVYTDFPTSLQPEAALSERTSSCPSH